MQIPMSGKAEGINTPDTGEKTLLHTLGSVFVEGRLNLLRRAKNSSHRRDMWEAGFNQNYNLR